MLWGKIRVAFVMIFDDGCCRLYDICQYNCACVYKLEDC